MSQSTEIVCPKCGSNQLTANKKGFSGTKAVGGAILTGGIGILAGTIGSNNILITCLACGKRFKPGEGKKVTTYNQDSTISTKNKINLESNTKGNRIICCDCQTENFINHKFCKNCKKELNDQDSRINSRETIPLFACTQCKNLAPKDGKFCPHCKSPLNAPKSGCFVATACYGDYNAIEVLVLRQYRDDKLLKTFLGRGFINFYYLVSPYFALLISKSDTLKYFIKHYFLNPIVSKLKSKYRP